MSHTFSFGDCSDFIACSNTSPHPFPSPLPLLWFDSAVVKILLISEKLYAAKYYFAVKQNIYVKSIHWLGWKWSALCTVWKKASQQIDESAALYCESVHWQPRIPSLSMQPIHAPYLRNVTSASMPKRRFVPLTIIGPTGIRTEDAVNSSTILPSRLN